MPQAKSAAVESVWKKISTVAAESPAPRRYHTGLISPTTQQLIVFGGMKGKTAAFDDLWLFDIVTAKWTRVQKQSAGDVWPCARCSHSATLFEGQMYVFGGLGGEGEGVMNALNDFYCLDLNTWKWTRLANDSAVPGPRYHHASAVNLHTRSLLMSGGSITNKKYQEDAWMYSFDKQEWKRVYMGRECFMAGHLLAWDQSTGKFHQFGGYTGDGGFEYLQDAYEISIGPDDKLEYAALKVNGTHPYTSRQIIGNAGGGGQSIFWVFGGFDGKSPAGDLVAYRFKERMWTPVTLWMEMDMASIAKSAASNANPRPTPRYGHCSGIYVREEVEYMLVFGGTGSTYLNDVVEIELPSF